jgi:FkbM family methyltransferase
MSKLKLILFQILNKLSDFLGKTGIHRRIPIIISIYDFLFQSFWPYKNIIEIQGSKMYIDIREKNPGLRRALQTYATNRIHEASTTNLFRKVVKEKDVVVDLGANIGYFTLLAAKLVGERGKVFAFEPEPKNYIYLKKNIEINNHHNVIAVQKAVSDKNGTTKLYLCDYDSGHHTINKYEGIEAYSRGRPVEKRSIEIETVTLDEFFKGKEESIDVIKMDVEGAETLALAGMDNILKTNKNLKMFVEFFPLLIRKMGNSPEEFIHRLLEDYHFSIYIIPGDYDAIKGKMIKINNVSELMSFCRGEKDHINLFLERRWQQ